MTARYYTRPGGTTGYGRTERPQLVQVLRFRVRMVEAGELN